ncbi:MAG: hypothetical protein WD176_06485 [Pirellulales bacterium]
MNRALRVIKLGGSLLGRSDLAARFDGWLDVQPPATNVIIVGGGRIVEALRELDHVHKLAPAAAHALAIDAMRVTAKLAATLLSRPVVDTLDVGSETGHMTVVLDVSRILAIHEPTAPGVRLEPGWHVTSDSIAARVAVMLGANELVLLKSAPAGSEDITALAARGYVDEFFPRIAREIATVRFVELGAEPRL